MGWPLVVPGVREGQAVEGSVVAIVAQELDLDPGGGGIERGTQGGELGVGLVAGGLTPLVHHEALAGPGLVVGQAMGDECGQLFQGQRFAVEIADIQIDDVQRMQMAVNQAGEDQATVEWLGSGVGADPLPGIGRAADEDDLLAVFYSKRLGDGVGRIDGVDFSAAQDEVGWSGLSRGGVVQRQADSALSARAAVNAMGPASSGRARNPNNGWAPWAAEGVAAFGCRLIKIDNRFGVIV